MSSVLFVPMTLDVLLANPALIARDRFRVWKYSYVNLGDDTFHSPAPLGFDSSFDTIHAGAYLHWNLPRSLRSSSQSDSAEFPLVPNRWLIVRIYRDAQGKNQQKAWVLESDCPNPNAEGASLFMVSDAVVAEWANSKEPNRKAALPVPISAATDTKANTVNIGMAFDQATWNEKAANNLFLTAVAPGNLDFCAYMPFNEGVFSFYDDLADAPANTTLSYMVTGWYSDPSADIIAIGVHSFTGRSSISDVLAALNWTVANNADPGNITSSLFSGLAMELLWNSGANSPPSPDQLEDVRATSNMTVAIANTGVDAFSTLIGQQLKTLPGYTDTAKIIELLRAFHYDLLPLLNNINGDALLAERVRQEWFSSKHGGTKWKIVADAPKNGTTPDISSGTLTPDEQMWLLQLNKDQKDLDDAVGELYQLQWDLNAVWWKSGYMNATVQQMAPNQTGIEASDLAQFLDPNNSSSTLSKVLDKLASINELSAKVPQPIYLDGVNAQDAFLNGVSAFAKQRNIAAGKSLKAVAQPRFWMPNNPNVLISGVQPSDITDPDASLTVRTSSQLISSFGAPGTSVTISAIESIIPQLMNTGSLPSGVTDIYNEFFLLDPSNSSQIAFKMGLDPSIINPVMTKHNITDYNSGVLPAIVLDAWSQQWNPLYIEWEIIHTPVPFEWIADPTTGIRTRNWSFNGTDYDLKSSVSGVGDAETLSGRSLLSPHLRFSFGARLKKFIDQYGDPGTGLKKLYDEIANTDNWKFLSQELVNLNEYLIQRDARPFRRPTAESFTKDGKNILFEKVIGFPDSTSMHPYDTPSNVQGLVNSIPAVKIGGPSDFPFHGIRSGQFYFSHLIIYDKFGRKLDLIDPAGSGVHDADNFPLVIDAALTVTNNLKNNIAAPFQLPPRLLQPSRLDILFLDQKDSSKILDLDNNVNPVCGWVIVNHLDQSLQVFTPDGTNVGEIRAVRGTSDGPIQWTSPPHNDITIAGITNIFPQLGAFITSITKESRTIDEFQAFIDAIDSTLWTIDPLGDRTDEKLSILIGRPLALLKVQLQFSLNGPPIESTDWPSPVSPVTANPNIPDFTTSAFSIRFGDQASREDGVIGYFENQEYSAFNSVVAPQTVQNFVKGIGPLSVEDGNYIHLPFEGSTTEIVTLLVDPRASIHATTGILPVKEVQIPAQFVNGPLSHIEVTFRVGPLLSKIQPASTSGGVTPPYPDTMSYLPVSEKNGTWSWWENTVSDPGTPDAKNNWTGFGLDNATINAGFKGQPTLREGFLQFVTDLETDKT
jgi:hypothetical protein